jgi:hypothetical protein
MCFLASRVNLGWLDQGALIQSRRPPVTAWFEVMVATETKAWQQGVGVSGAADRKTGVEKGSASCTLFKRTPSISKYKMF